MSFDVRSEQEGDEQAIYDVTLAAFEPKAFSDGTEAPLIDALRKDGDLTISLVAVQDGDIVGHVAFSPVTISGATGDWYGLGPIAVRPDVQRSGIGSGLIHRGLSILKSGGAEGCALIGDPDYYGRFGFKSDGRLHYEGVPDKHVQWLSFGDEAPHGTLLYCSAFQTSSSGQ